MKKLYLLRHAKAAEGPHGGDDHARPLAPRGEADAASVGRWLAAAGIVPDLALCSSARRTRQTLDRVASAADWSIDVETTDDLYLCRPADVVGLLRRQDDRRSSLLVVGHEPTTSALASLLSGGGEVKVATATLVRLGLEVESWGDVEPGCGRIEWVVPVKSIA